MPPPFTDYPPCSCTETEPCALCRFCKAHNTQQGRKALCEKITRILVVQPFYRQALAQAMHALFPDKIIRDDEKDICTMLFEAVLFEDTSAGATPLSYFIENAPLSPDERRLYAAWRSHTSYGFFAVEKVIAGKEVHLAALAGGKRCRVYEQRAATTLGRRYRHRRIVPFLNAWMFTTETILSFSGSAVERLQTSYGLVIRQFVFVRKYHEDHKRRMAG